MDTYLLLRFGHFAGFILLGAGLLAVFLSELRAYRTRDPKLFAEAVENTSKKPVEGVVASGAGPAQTVRFAILPQAIPPVIPALGNYLVNMFKETPLLSAIAVLELMQTAKIIGAETFRYLEPMTLVGVFFLIMSSTSAAGIRRLEHWLRDRRR